MLPANSTMEETSSIISTRSTMKPTELSDQSTENNNQTALRGRGSCRRSRGLRRGAAVGSRRQGGVTSSTASYHTRGRVNGRGVTTPRGRGSTRSRGQPRKRRGGGRPNELLEEGAQEHRPAPNYVDIKVVEKIIGRVTEGMHYVNQAKACFDQAQEELRVIHACLKGVHGIGNTLALDNDVSESIITDQKPFSAYSLDNLFNDGESAEDVQLSVDPSLYSYCWQTGYTNDYDSCLFNQESNNQADSIENNEFQNLFRNTSVEQELLASTAACAFPDKNGNLNQMDNEESEEICKMEEEKPKWKKPQPRKKPEKSTSSVPSSSKYFKFNAIAIDEYTPSVYLLNCKDVFDRNLPLKDHLGTEQIEQDIKLLEGRFITQNSSKRPAPLKETVKEVKQVSVKRKYCPSLESKSDDKINFTSSMENVLVEGHVNTEGKKAKYQIKTLEKKIPVWKQVLQPSEELKEKRKQRLKEIVLGCQSMPLAKPKDTPEIPSIPKDTKHEDFGENAHTTLEEKQPNGHGRIEKCIKVESSGEDIGHRDLVDFGDKESSRAISPSTIFIKRELPNISSQHETCQEIFTPGNVSKTLSSVSATPAPDLPGELRQRLFNAYKSFKTSQKESHDGTVPDGAKLASNVTEENASKNVEIVEKEVKIEDDEEAEIEDPDETCVIGPKEQEEGENTLEKSIELSLPLDSSLCTSTNSCDAKKNESASAIIVQNDSNQSESAAFVLNMPDLC